MNSTFVVIQLNIFDAKMVGLEALIAGLLGRETLLELGEEDPSLGTGLRIVEALQERS